MADQQGFAGAVLSAKLNADKIHKIGVIGECSQAHVLPFGGSPSTGRYYNMPLETCDGAYGRYHNPDHPEEILNPTQPGN